MPEQVLQRPRSLQRRVEIEGVMQYENEGSHFGWSERHGNERDSEDPTITSRGVLYEVDGTCRDKQMQGLAVFKGKTKTTIGFDIMKTTSFDRTSPRTYSVSGASITVTRASRSRHLFRKSWRPLAILAIFPDNSSNPRRRRFARELA